MTAYIVLSFVGFVLVAAWALTSLAERTAEWRKTRGIKRSGRKAAKARHPAGKHIPPSLEVWAAGHGVYDQEQDAVIAHIEAMWDLPDARKEGAS